MNRHQPRISRASAARVRQPEDMKWCFGRRIDDALFSELRRRFDAWLAQSNVKEG